jgi:hypothetical protein
MSEYIVNKRAQNNGDHEVHKTSCSVLPEIYNRLDLGFHNNCFEAVRKAKEIYQQSNGCKYCCNECHTS